MNKKIAICNLEPKIYNTALMQISSYYKSQGYEVEWYNPFFHNEYEKIYASVLFNFTARSYITKDVILGGDGL